MMETVAVVLRRTPWAERGSGGDMFGRVLGVGRAVGVDGMTEVTARGTTDAN